METTWRTGPVAVTGASGRVGQALQARLAGLPNDVRATGRDADLKASVADAQVVVHLAGSLQPRRPNSYVAADLDSVRATAAALSGSTVERVVFLSFLTADRASANDYLRTKAEAEQVLEATGVPTVVFRTGHVFGPPTAPGPTAESLLVNHGRATVLGSGTQRLQPILLEDVVEAVVRAGLDPATPTGTFELAGPDVFTVDQVVHVLNAPSAPIRHLPAWLARALAWVVPSLLRPLVDVLLSDAVATTNVQSTAERFGFELHGLDRYWHPQDATSGPPRSGD